MTARDGRRDAADAAMLQLIRLVLDDAWTASAAATELWERVPDHAVLRRAKARVTAALTDRPSAVARRAVATLDLAMNQGLPRPPDPSLVDHGPQLSAGSLR